jgi:hypothetical protein
MTVQGQARGGFWPASFRRGLSVGDPYFLAVPSAGYSSRSAPFDIELVE